MVFMMIKNFLLVCECIYVKIGDLCFLEFCLKNYLLFVEFLNKAKISDL